MFNKKGFTTIELLVYLVVCSILVQILNIVIKQSTYLSNDNDIYILQSVSVLQHDLVKYKDIKTCSDNLILFDDDVKIQVKDQMVYQTPGFMPYLQNVDKLKFKCLPKSIKVNFYYHEKEYDLLVFISK